MLCCYFIQMFQYFISNLFYFLFVGIYCYLLYSCSGFENRLKLKEFVIVVFYVISISIIRSFHKSSNMCLQTSI